MGQEDTICQIAKFYGLALEYVDIWGHTHTVSEETVLKLLKAMGIHLDVNTNLESVLTISVSTLWKRCLEPVQVIKKSDFPAIIALKLPQNEEDLQFQWTILKEDGGYIKNIFCPRDLTKGASIDLEEGIFSQYLLSLPSDLPLGYHRFKLLKLTSGTPSETSMLIIVTPDQCYLPPLLKEGKRIWGIAAQLYSLKSSRNWGIGDLSDITNLIDWCADSGADFIGLNPLHALFTARPSHKSPYSPSSRHFYNILYLDIEAIPDFKECEEAQSMVFSDDFQMHLKSIREKKFVDYAEVAAIKLKILETLFSNFVTNHLGRKTKRACEFHTYLSKGGKSLERFAIFEALNEHFHNKDPDMWGWPAWPEPYRNPENKAIYQFTVKKRKRIEFYKFLQWQIEAQLAFLKLHASKSGLLLGLYLDMAVSIDRGGADTWINQGIYALDASIGTPPDDFNLNGQDWGLPPMIPSKLKDQCYTPFIKNIRSIMQYAGAIRIDHVMSFMRLFCIPLGASPVEGAYVNYSFEDLMGILALESHRNKCIVIGEDLGTVPDAVRDAMPRWGALSCRLLYFTKEWGGEFTPSNRYPKAAVVSVSTHDLPTLKGYWTESDLNLRSELDLFPSEDIMKQQFKSRSLDQSRLLRAIKAENLLPEKTVYDSNLPMKEMSPELSFAIHLFLARTPCMMFIVQLEDMILQEEQANLPGTIEEYPNWCRKLGISLDDLRKAKHLISLVKSIGKERA